MVWNWLFKRLFTPERFKELIKSSQKELTETIVESLHGLLEDEDLASHLVAYTDGLYDRYLGKGGKLWSSIGGKQKGLNFAINGEMDKLNPLSGLIDEDGNLSLSGMVKGFLSNALQGNAPQTPSTFQNVPNTGSVPLMQPIT